MRDLVGVVTVGGWAVETVVVMEVEVAGARREVAEKKGRCGKGGRWHAHGETSNSAVECHARHPGLRKEAPGR